MRKQLAMVAVLTLMLLTGVALGGHALYEHHLSSDVRAAVLASLGNNVSDADVAVYLRTAKLAIRTKRDAYIVGLLDKIVEQVTEAEKDKQEFSDALISDMDSEDAIMGACGPNSSGDGCRLELRTDVPLQKSDREVETRALNGEAAKIKDAARLTGILRTEMGLPPIPKPTK